MGDVNQWAFVQRHRSEFRGPYLEVGSADYGSTQNLRSLFPAEPYLGIDMLERKGVDRVVDLTRPFEEVDRLLDGQRFGTIFCLSVLEHCSQPFTMAATMTALLAPGGCVYVSVPWAWKFHGYPSDYWRFTHEGVKQLFPGLRFDIAQATTAADGAAQPLDPEIGRTRVSASYHRKRGHPGRALTSLLLRVLPVGWLTRHDYLMVPTMIDMIGRKPA